MKKILFTVISFSIFGSVIAQDAADKSFQGGLVFGAGMNFQRELAPEMSSNGVGSDLTIGGNINIMFNESIGLTTGIEFDFNTTKYKPESTNVYYLYNGSNIEKIESSFQDIDGNINFEGKNVFQLESRKQKATYLTIPTMLLFRTDFIGYMRYFGKFGLRSSFLLSQKTNDMGFEIDTATFNQKYPSLGAQENNDFTAKNEMVFFKTAVGIAGGAEWNFTGSTCLVAEIGYYYGLMPLYYDRSSPYLFTSRETNGTSTDKTFSNAAKQSQLQLKVSILF